MYALVGGGFYAMTADVSPSMPGIGSASKSYSDTPFGFHLGGGLRVPISPQALLGVEAKYIAGTAEIAGASSHFNSLLLLGGVTFRM